MTRLTRRALLAAAALAAIGGGGVAYRSRSGFDADLEQTEDVARLFDDLEPARRIGRAYLELHPDESSERAIVQALERQPPWPFVWDRPPELIAAVARAAIRRDFAAGRTVVLNGWTVSVTEARLCALTTFG